MVDAVPRISAVAVTAPNVITVTWSDSSMTEVDLTDWIEGGSDLLAPLKQADVFARAGVGAFGGNVTWDEDEGDLAIDSLHLKQMAGLGRSVHAAA